MIRLARATDAKAIAGIYEPIVAGTATSFELVPPAAEEMARRVAATLAYTPWLVFEVNGAVAAYAYASRHRERAAYQWSVDVSVYVDGAFQRQGIARRLYEALLTMLRLQGFYTAHAGISLPNAASVGLHESMGFEPIGIYRSVGFKLGQWHDVGWWQLPLRPRQGEPEPPRPLPEAMKDRDWMTVVPAR